MFRGLRVEYAGAIYHVMNRGNRRERIFRGPVDFELMLKTLDGGVGIARRLWTQTTLTLSQIANLLKMGSWSYAAHLIYKPHDKTTNNED
jgi:hypothetical protein